MKPTIRLFGTAIFSLGLLNAWAADPAPAAPPPPNEPSTTQSSTPSRGSGSVEKIDLNTADQATLQLLPGVTAEVAQAIVAARPFKSVEDVARVEGMGEARLEILKEQITVSTASTAVAETKSTEPALEPTGRTDTQSQAAPSSPKSESTKSDAPTPEPAKPAAASDDAVKDDSAGAKAK